MRTTKLLAGAALALTTAAGAAGSDWSEIRNPDELRALYSNKTFRFHHAEVDRPAVLHWRADGKGMMLLMGRTYPRTWAIEGRDQVCISDDIRGRLCYKVLRNAQDPAEILINPTNGGMGSFMKVEDGIPQF